MNQNEFVFWLMVISGAVVCAWWLAIRPGPSPRDLATPVAGLAMILAAMMAMLALTGSSAEPLINEVLAIIRGY
jgi:hypothetical protein